jgi:ABC-type nitrate/sulfonate/bicarbonate transport system ATPase subunit
MKIDLVRETKVSRSTRVKQLEAMFDVPPSEKARMQWSGDLPIEEIDNWNVGLIVGPSGCGKSTILREVIGSPEVFEWGVGGGGGL